MQVPSLEDVGHDIRMGMRAEITTNYYVCHYKHAKKILEKQLDSLLNLHVSADPSFRLPTDPYRSRDTGEIARVQATKVAQELGITPAAVKQKVMAIRATRHLALRVLSNMESIQPLPSSAPAGDDMPPLEPADDGLDEVVEVPPPAKRQCTPEVKQETNSDK